MLSNAAANLAEMDRRYHFHSQSNAVRHAAEGPLVIVSGEGPYVRDENGKRYLDGVASLWCASLGFSDTRLADAGSRALRDLPVYHTFNHRSNPYAAELSKEVAQLAPFPDARVFFTDGGSESVDTMAKLAWYYQVAVGRPERRKIIARQGGFHGSTVFAARLSGLPAMHRSFNLPDCNVVHVARPHFYRDAAAGEDRAEFASRLARELEETIEAEGPGTIAAFVAEPVMGAGGVIVPPDGYFPAVMEVLRRHDILVIADEIICGFGRTGNWFGCHTLGFTPDMMSIAKGLSAGYAPIGGVIVAPHVFEVIAQESQRNGVFSHGFTYSGHPVSAAISLEALSIYREMDLPRVAAERGRQLQSALQRLKHHPLVGDVRSLGFLAGVELMADPARRVPFAPELGVGARVERQVREHGLILRNLGDTMAICPPYIVTEAEIEFLVEALIHALDDVGKSLPDEITSAE